jgi:hypothetical protein
MLVPSSIKREEEAKNQPNRGLRVRVLREGGLEESFRFDPETGIIENERGDRAQAGPRLRKQLGG